MTWGKRLFDIAFALLLIALLLVPFLIMLLVLLIVEGRPLFYVSERMKTADTGFALIKLRTMANVASDGGVTGGDKVGRIGPVHRVLRKTRFDELPQLINVLKGDMSFVGPRPPLRVYVRDYPEVYGQVLRNRPGITGLASLHFHRAEEALLSRCETSAETDAVYRSRCIPRKARLDLIYQRHQSLCFDLRLIADTALRLVRR